MSDNEDTEEFDQSFFQSNQGILKSNKYIQENHSLVSHVHNYLIQPNYFYKVGMTFNNRCRIQGTGLNPTKRGRPTSNVVFQKNSCLFDNCKINPRWQQ